MKKENCEHPWHKQCYVVEGVVCDMCGKLLSKEELAVAEKEFYKTVKGTKSQGFQG